MSGLSSAQVVRSTERGLSIPATPLVVVDGDSGVPLTGVVVQPYAVRKATLLGLPVPFARYRVTAGAVETTDEFGTVRVLVGRRQRLLFRAAGFVERHIDLREVEAVDGVVVVRLEAVGQAGSGPRQSPLTGGRERNEAGFADEAK